uniref:Transient receptor potential cation channel subfamily C member 2a n=1 Tax=Sinocyclocheilus grahami TaxID=75366 RepID=A0A672L4P5_SINGR
MTSLLLGVKFDFRQIHEALLVAVDTNQPRFIKHLLDRLDQEKGNKMDVRSFSMAVFDHSIDDSQYAPGVTPLTLACQKDLYEIITMLTQRGHDIPLPHAISCTCLECRNGRQYDLHKFSLSRINTYRGIASRAYLSITSEDAMLSAFHLSRELRKLSKKEPEFKPQYLEFEQLCQEFGVELLGMCRNQSEVSTILNSADDDSEDEELNEQTFGEGIPNLARLRLAVNYNQKQVHHVSLIAATDKCDKTMSLSILSIFFKNRKNSKVNLKSIFMEIYQSDFASRKQNILHNSLHMVWVAGIFFWFECKEVWIEGLKSFFLDLWNIVDMMVLSMYLASFTLRILIMLKGYFLCQDSSTQELCEYFTNDRKQEDPQLIAETLFAVTSMLSFTRLAYILPAHESLGTLQISMGRMIDNMMRFMFILMIIGTAFLCGINNIYVPYVVSPHLDMADYVLAEFVGRIFYGIFTLLIVIVLLNMLIAMISNSFQRIEDDADVEWKFARSKLYLSYIREGLTMPVPFNIIPSPKAPFYTLRSICQMICCCCNKKAPEYPPIASLVSQGEGRVPYRLQVTKALVHRYIEAARREVDVGNRITELNKVVGRLHSEMQEFHQKLQWRRKSEPDQASILGKYIMGAMNNFCDLDKNEAMGCENTGLPISTHPAEEEDDDEREEEIKAGGIPTASVPARDVIKLQLVNKRFFLNPFYTIRLHLASALVHKQFSSSTLFVPFSCGCC